MSHSAKGLTDAASRNHYHFNETEQNTESFTKAQQTLSWAPPSLAFLTSIFDGLTTNFQILALTTPTN